MLVTKDAIASKNKSDTLDNLTGSNRYILGSKVTKQTVSLDLTGVHLSCVVGSRSSQAN